MSADEIQHEDDHVWSQEELAEAAEGLRRTKALNDQRRAERPTEAPAPAASPRFKPVSDPGLNVHDWPAEADRLRGELAGARAEIVRLRGIVEAQKAPIRGPFSYRRSLGRHANRLWHENQALRNALAAEYGPGDRDRAILAAWDRILEPEA